MQKDSWNCQTCACQKTKVSITSQWRSSLDFCQWLTVFSTRQIYYTPQFNGPEVVSSASDKPWVFAENFSNNSNLDESNLSWNRSSPILISKSKSSGVDFIPGVVLDNCEPDFYTYKFNYSRCVLRNRVFLIVGRSHLWSLYWRMFGQLQTTVLLFYFL